MTQSQLVIDSADDSINLTNNPINRVDIQPLLAIGRNRGFVTAAEILQLVPIDSMEHIDHVYAALSKAGVPVQEEDDPTLDNGSLLPIDDDISDDLLGDSVQLYLREIGQVPLLTAEQENMLASTIKRGQDAERKLAVLPSDSPETNRLRMVKAQGDEARQQMVAANLRLVVSIAKRYRNRGLSLLDLIQEGNLGLLRAIEKFDVTKGYRFSTYATWWIRQAISRALADQSRLVRLPVHLGETLNRIQAVRRQLTQTLGREPTDDELAEALRMTTNKLRDLQRIAQAPVSLSTPVGEDRESTLADVIPDRRVPDAYEAASGNLLRQQITSALNQLGDRERHVLELRYGLTDNRPLTLEEVGKALGITRERVRQIEAKALSKLRRPRTGNLLKDYLDQL